MTHSHILTAVQALVVVLCTKSWAQTTELVSVASGGAQGNSHSYETSISSDGRYLAFVSEASNLVPGDTNGYKDVFVRDRQAGTIERVSVSAGGAQGNGDSFSLSLSADGRYVAFFSAANNLVPGDTNGFGDIFVHDRQASTTDLVSVDSFGVQGNAASYSPSISADGSYVAFESFASNLVPGDTNPSSDVFVRELEAGVTERVSVDSAGAQGNLGGGTPSISADGRYVAFASAANNLVAGDTNGVPDVLVRDRLSGTTERVSVDSSGVQGNGHSIYPAISADGRYVVFQSLASNLVPGDTNGGLDVFVRDRQAGTTERVSVDSVGAQGNSSGFFPPIWTRAAISSDGRYVAFVSDASNLVPGDSNGAFDVFMRDRQVGTTERVSVGTVGAQGNAQSFNPSISPGGRYVAFASVADNFVPADTNGAGDAFLRDRGVASAFARFCSGDDSGAACPCGNSGSPGHGCENSAGTGGALLTVTGVASLSADTVQITCSGELPSALSILLQGDTVIAATGFGDGLRCTGGTLKRLYVKSAIGGVVVAPQSGDPSISARSAALGDPIPLGATRLYQVLYRNALESFCPNPPGGTFNVSNAIAVAWGN